MSNVSPEAAVIHTEMQDAAKHPMDICAAPAAATIELAALIARFEDNIDPEWRHRLIYLGGALLALDAELDRGKNDV